MRNEIIKLIENKFKKKNNEYFLTADLGFSVLEDLKKKIKDRFINVGVAENNMFLISVGLNSITKSAVYVYSISSFLILRSVEIIRNYVSNDKRNIKIIGVGSGVSYDKMGKTHFNLDDINIVYSLKNILILNPANKEELNFVFKKFYKSKQPIYYRINKFNFLNSYNLKKIGNIYYKPGTHVNLITSGAILNHILSFFSQQEIKKFNIISLPILDQKYLNFNIKKYLLKKNTFMAIDSKKTLFFEEIKSTILKYYPKLKITNFDLDHNKIKKVGDYKKILNDVGLDKKKLSKYLISK